jgi:hypothetical protein
MRRPGYERRAAHGRPAVLLVVVACAWCAATAAAAADPARTPSGEPLRETYPLHTKPAERRSPDPMPAPSRRAGQRTNVQPPRTQKADATPALVVLLLILPLGAATLWLVRGRTSGDGSEPDGDTDAPPPPRPRAISLALFEDATAPEPIRGAQRTPKARPPDPARKWTAEIAWRESDGESRFVVAARPGRGAKAVVLTSDPVPWPPAGPDDVASLQRVVSGLEAALLSAGWTALEPGDAWYARRFAWAPVARPAPPPRPAPASPRTSPAARELPRRFGQASASGPWRCEIEWHFLATGWGFRAYAIQPPSRSRLVVAESASHFARVDRDTPDARAALDGVVRALAKSGWELSESGTPTVWTGEGNPPRLPPTDVARFTEKNQT